MMPTPGLPPPLGAWRLTATIRVPTVTADGKGGQTVSWADGPQFAALEVRPMAGTETIVGGGLRSQLPLTIRTWYREDVFDAAVQSYGKTNTVSSRLRLSRGAPPRPVEPYEIVDAVRVGGPIGESMWLDLTLLGVTDEEAEA